MDKLQNVFIKYAYFIQQKIIEHSLTLIKNSIILKKISKGVTSFLSSLYHMIIIYILS